MTNLFIPLLNGDLIPIFFLDLEHDTGQQTFKALSLHLVDVLNVFRVLEMAHCVKVLSSQHPLCPLLH